MEKKPIIFYCDDKLDNLKRFVERHEAHFEIITLEDGREFASKLKALIEEGKTPDIILIDLYHPHDPPAQDDVVEHGREAMTQLDQDNAVARQAIEAAWQPLGVELLKQARRLCPPEIPMAIYTEHGLAIADNNNLATVSQARGKWFLKGKDSVYEQNRLQGMLDSAQERMDAKAAKEAAKAAKEMEIKKWRKINLWMWVVSVCLVIASCTYILMVGKDLEEYILTVGLPLVVPTLISFMEWSARKKE